MVRNKSTIPNGHFHKKWQRHVKINFDEPLRKRKRQITRAKKLHRGAPRPIALLRSVVRCPTARYNTKLRLGRGFTLQELKAAKINPKWASTVGIAVDLRRKNKSVEGQLVNVQRLKEYLQRLVVFPLNKKKAKEEPGVQVYVRKSSEINRMSKFLSKVKARVPSKEEKEFQAYITLRKARADVRLVGIRTKREKADDMDRENEKNSKKRGKNAELSNE